MWFLMSIHAIILTKILKKMKKKWKSRRILANRKSWGKRKSERNPPFKEILNAIEVLYNCITVFACFSFYLFNHLSIQLALWLAQKKNECKRCRYRLNWYFQCLFIDKFVRAVVRLYRTLSRAPDPDGHP